MLDFGVKHMWASSHPASASTRSAALSQAGACPWCGWCSSDLPTWLFPAAVYRSEFSLQAEWKSWGQLLNGCCSSHPVCKSCPVALAGEQLWAELGLGWRWSIYFSFWSPSRISWALLTLCHLADFAHQAARNAGGELFTWAQPWVNWEWGEGHGQQWGTAAITGTCSYQPKSAVMVAGQKERTEGERHLYLQVKDNFKNSGSQHECCHTACLKIGRCILKLNNPLKYKKIKSLLCMCF